MNTDAFDQAYKSLNTEQKLAVDTIEGPVMVIAGPGTGKTTILALRIANILKQTDTPASGILAITFTEAGVKAMRLKLRSIIGSRADEISLYTFHGFASRIIAEFGDHFTHLFKTKQMTDIEAENMLREILKDKKFKVLRPLGEPDYYIQKIVSAISDCRKEALTPEMVKSFAEEEIKRIKNDESSISTRGKSKGQLKADALKSIEKCQKTIVFSDIYAEYENRKQAERKIDFDDLIFELMLALKRDELLLQLLQEKYLYILVDEHQDTNDAQNAVIKIIADFFEIPNLFVVGDEKQAIFRFQGASVQNFLKFQNIWSEMKVISLQKNYRSHQAILDASFKMIENNYAPDEYQNLRVKLQTGLNKKSQPIDWINASNYYSADDYLIKSLQDVLKKDEDSKVAIIVRTNKEVEKIINLLADNDISAMAERGVDIFSHPLGILFFDLINLAIDPSQDEYLAKTISSGLWGLDFKDIPDLLKKIKKGEQDDVFKKISSLEKINKEVGKLNAINFLFLLAQESGLTTLASKDPKSAEVWRGLVTLSQEIALTGGIEDPKSLMTELLAYKQSAEHKSVKVSTGRQDERVSVMTAHGAKGLEYEYVFLPFATEESWVPKYRGSSFVFSFSKDDKDGERDSRRLFYVALTRAKDHLVIISPMQDLAGKPLTPLRFIEELDPSSVNKIDLKALDIPVSKDFSKLESSRLKEIVNYSKRVLAEKGLSVTALNHFIECPRKFFYKSILKMPEPGTASSEKGNAMHEAMSAVWHLDKKEEALITKTIQESVDFYLKKSLLPTFEKEAVLEELIQSAPVVTKALLGHFQGFERVLSEVWEETTFITGNSEIPQISLHGRLDALSSKDDEVFVFDYKTMKSMSENEIKGDTKNSDGGYFRQLVFYKLLLDSKSDYRGKNIKPALVFLKPDEKGRCPIITLPIEKRDISDLENEIKKLVKDVSLGAFLDKDCDNKDCDFCKLWQVSN